jgi:hypothetical protein
MNRRSIAGMGYVGFQALIFIEFKDYGTQDETYEKLRRKQHKIYSYLKGYLPEFFDKEGKREYYNKEIAPMLDAIAERINETRELYSPLYEGIHTWSEDENKFQISLDGTYEDLVTITAKTKIVDKEKIESEEMTFG